MRFLFLLVLLLSIGLTWLALGQQGSEPNIPPPPNMPRVDRLMLVAEAPITEEEGREVTVVKNEPEPEPEPEAWTVEFDRLPLPLPSELLDWQNYTSIKAQLEPVPVALNEEESMVCLTVAGFRDNEHAQAWSRLRQFGSEMVAGTRTVSEKPLHWVVLPPAESRAAGLALLRKVQAAGLDSYLVTEGDMRHAISLGLFESRQAAQRVLESRRQAGLAAELTLFDRTRLEPIVRVFTGRSGELIGALPEELTATKQTDACQALQR